MTRTDRRVFWAVVAAVLGLSLALAFAFLSILVCDPMRRFTPVELLTFLTATFVFIRILIFAFVSFGVISLVFHFR